MGFASWLSGPLEVWVDSWMVDVVCLCVVSRGSCPHTHAVFTVLHFLPVISSALHSRAPLFCARGFKIILSYSSPSTRYRLLSKDTLELTFVWLLALCSAAVCSLQVGTDRCVVKVPLAVSSTADLALPGRTAPATDNLHTHFFFFC